jgi:hypothetical protein
MAHESQGQQLIVVMKWSNVHGAKGHSHSKLMFGLVEFSYIFRE